MTNSDIQLNSCIRSNLLLQKTSSQLSSTQLRLSTGNKVNSALDGPSQFFSAKGLSQRASDLSSLKDSIGQAVSTITAADKGIDEIENLVDQARGLTTQALGSLGNDANSVKQRKALAESFTSILRQVDKLAQDSAYQGKNLLVGSGLRLDAADSSSLAQLHRVIPDSATSVAEQNDFISALDRGHKRLAEPPEQSGSSAQRTAAGDLEARPPQRDWGNI
jgi:flagellin-like hook-associated protein FlgL